MIDVREFRGLPASHVPVSRRVPVQLDVIWQNIVSEAPSDEIELMQRTAKCDAAAFRLLVEIHLAAIMNFAYRMLYNQTDAEDVVQETFLRLWSEAHRYR